jgi:hypothetical protein
VRCVPGAGGGGWGGGWGGGGGGGGGGRIEQNIIGYTEGRTDVGTVRKIIDAVLTR